MYTPIARSRIAKQNTGGICDTESLVSLAQAHCEALIENMFGVTTSDDYRPVAWMGRYPVDVTTMLVGVHVVCAVLACIVTAIPGLAGTLNYFIFDSAQIWNGLQVWRLGSYAFVHLPSSLLWFAVEMYLLFVFGREVERFLGRRTFIGLYLTLLLTPATLLTVWGLWERSAITGSAALHFGIFVAFATIYPRVEMLLRIQAKWVALILAAIYTLQLIAYHAWSELVVVWTSIGVAFLFVELNGAGPELAWWNDFKARFASKPKYHVLPKPRARTLGSRSDPEDVYTSIDPILDKISKFGIGSLTASEQRQLYRERERLLKNSE